MKRVITSLLGCALLMLPTAAHAASLDSPRALTLVSKQQLDSRLFQLTFSTPALTSETGVRILLPTGYASDPTRRYPVLYLLHGGGGGFSDWTEQGNAEALTAGLGAIVVMADGGVAGYYSDWYNFGEGGPPEWETYHIGELLPWIDAHYRTIPTRGERAIAGLSMGGFGALSYAARHPDLFAVAASFSGSIDMNYPSPTGQPDVSVGGGALPETWGPYQTDQVIWRAHNPWDLAENLRGLDPVVRIGNGLPGGPYPYDPAAGGLESYLHQQNLDMNAKLNALGIPHLFDDYGPGDHSWPYWQRDLKETLPQIMSTFAHPPPPPASVTFTAAEPNYSVYGWSVSVMRTAMEFSTLEHATSHGFALSGSGNASVMTPADFTPGRVYPLTITPQTGAASHVGAVADSTGRLEVRLPLGPANSEQQYTPGATTRVYRTTVAIGATPAPQAQFSCAGPSGRLAGASLGPVRLGMTRARARSRFARVSLRGRRYMDFFCPGHGGIRVGYASPRLLDSVSPRQRPRLRGRVVLVLTSNRHYALRGVRPGARLASASRRLRVGQGFQVGVNRWYLVPDGSGRGVLKVRHGVVQEIGIADRNVTAGPSATRRFFTSFS